MKKIDTNFYILNCIAIVIYFIIILNLKTGVNHEIMYSTPDSQSYLDVVNWLESGVETESTSIRPILYPLLIMLSSKVCGFYGVWIFQLLLWLFTINLTFLSVKKLTGNYLYGYVSAILISSNLSLIALTLHALTEVTTTFLLSVLIFFIVKNIQRSKDLFFLHGCLTILVVLTILKPVFLIPLLITLLIILPLFYLRKYIISPIKIVSLILLLLPFFIQLTIMKVKHDSITVSKISSQTFTDYLFAKGVEEIEDIDRIESVKKSRSLSKREKLNYLIMNKKTYFPIFFSNIKENIKARPTFLSYPKGFKHTSFRNYMIQVNEIYYYLHIIFILPILFLSLLFLKNKDYSNLTILLIMTFLCSYYIIVTGVSFLQGDRLVLPSIAIWTCLYVFTIFSFMKILHRTINKCH